MRKIALIILLGFCQLGFGLVFDGVDGKATLGDLGNIKTFSIWCNLATTTEVIADMNGTASIEAGSGTITATGWTTPTIYVDGVAGSAITADEWHHVAIVSDTAINASAVIIANDGASYAAGSFEEHNDWDRALSLAEIQQEYQKQALMRGRGWVTPGVELDAGMKGEGVVPLDMYDGTNSSLKFYSPLRAPGVINGGAVTNAFNSLDQGNHTITPSGGVTN